MYTRLEDRIDDFGGCGQLLTSSAAPNTTCVLAALYKPIRVTPECHTTLSVQEFLLLLIRFVNCTDKSVQQVVGLFFRISAIRKACIPSS
jgi:hypothetical protein